MGERVIVETAAACGGIFDETGRPSKPCDPANPATGPIALAGVRAGEIVAVRIHEVRPVGFGKGKGIVFAPDPSARKLAFHGGLEWTLDPSIGVIGVVPASPGEETHNGTCGPHGGNMDCRDIAASATVFFRARVDGANFGFGDVHFEMGDGEIEGQGVEGAADAVLSFHRAAPGRIEGTDWPWLVRRGEIMTLAGHTDFRTAVHVAYEAMQSLCARIFRTSRDDVTARIVPAGHLRVCQSCCPVMTVRLALPLALFGTTEERLLAEILP